MSSSSNELLQSYCSHLKEWDAAVAAGAAALQTLQQCFSNLQPASGTQEVPKILERLQGLAPSFRLSSYISNLLEPTTTADPDLAADLHQAHTALQAALSVATQQLQQLQDIAEQYTDAALAQQLETGLSTADPCQQQLQHEPDDSSDETTPVVTSAATAKDDSEAPTAASAEEVGLLLSAATAGMQKDLHWMELVGQSITLDTSPTDLETYSTFWDLQPFTDEQALAAIRQQAAAEAEEAG